MSSDIVFLWNMGTHFGTPKADLADGMRAQWCVLATMAANSINSDHRIAMNGIKCGIPLHGSIEFHFDSENHSYFRGYIRRNKGHILTTEEDRGIMMRVERWIWWWWLLLIIIMAQCLFTIPSCITCYAFIHSNKQQRARRSILPIQSWYT